MNNNLDKASHSVYLLQYYFVQSVEYRRDMLVNPLVVDCLKKPYIM
jgi:REP element-mobilizing transposase RayT